MGNKAERKKTDKLFSLYDKTFIIRRYKSAVLALSVITQSIYQLLTSFLCASILVFIVILDNTITTRSCDFQAKYFGDLNFEKI